ncbi:hypothetical protein MASR1M32_17400 [Rhodobacter sp.]
MMIPHPEPTGDPPPPPPPEPDPPPTAGKSGGGAHNPARDNRGRFDHQADAQAEVRQAC